MGDTSFGENYQIHYREKGQKNILQERGYDYPLEQLKDILIRSDLVIANLETPVIDASMAASTLTRIKKDYIHWTDAQNAPKYLTKYNIKVMSLANNHTLDYGLVGLKQTFRNLQNTGIEFFGAGNNEYEAARPYFQEFSVGRHHFRLAIIAAFEFREEYGVKFGFYAKCNNAGVNMLSIEGISNQIKDIRRADPETFIIVMPHWGRNYAWKSEKQTTLGHQITDAGANMVIGHGEHMMQEIEKYNGHWILYGIGNFMFNSKGRYKKYTVEPFSLVPLLVLKANGDGHVVKTLQLYLIFTDNRVTNFQSRMATQNEFKRAYATLSAACSRPRQFENDVKKCRDTIGPFMEFLIE